MLETADERSSTVMPSETIRSLLVVTHAPVGIAVGWTEGHRRLLAEDRGTDVTPVIS